MIPVNQFILGSSDPLLYPSEKMTNSIDEQILTILMVALLIKMTEKKRF